jgi:hypothetical protein
MQEHIAHGCQVELSSFFIGTLLGNPSFYHGESLNLFQISLLSRVEETHVFLERQTSVLESLASRILLPCEN